MSKSPSQSDSPIWINYFYFGVLFAILILLSVGGVLSREDLGGSKLFFLFYSVGEASLEVLFFILLGWLIRKYMPKMFFFLYIGFTFLAFIFHLIDFMIDRVLNFTIWETLGFIFDESFDNFIHMLAASGLPLWAWLSFFLLLTFIPVIGIGIYQLTDWLAKYKPLKVRLDLILQLCFCLPIALFLWDLSASRIIGPEAHISYVKSLPWKITFLRPDIPTIPLPTPPPHPEKSQERLDRFTAKVDKKPNIYLFVVESLRRDVICNRIAPHLTTFKTENIQTEISLSNANATQISWYSLFHSDYPYYWTSEKEVQTKRGGMALQLLRKLGYDIRVYTSADLRYYNMNESLFGKNEALATAMNKFTHDPPKEAWQSDAQTVDAFIYDIEQHPEYRQGQCFIFFWDATHFDYSWPKDVPPTFSPIASGMNYFQAYHSPKQIEAMRNSYHNAVNYIDELFSKATTHIPNRDEAIIVLTGDHGEEFLEHGHLFHNSQLSESQTNIPILLKLPRRPEVLPTLMTQMDIFPTIIDALTYDGATNGVLQGQSLFLQNRWPYGVIARYNASRTPCEFCIHNDTHKLITCFNKRRDIFHSTFLQILSVRTVGDLICTDYQQDRTSWINDHFGPALERLFPTGTILSE